MPPLGDIGIIVLAAGQSRRFQGDKRQARLPDGRSLLQASLASVPDSLRRRVVVLRPGDEALAETLPADWERVYAHAATEGMGSSLAAGIRAICPWSCDWECGWQSEWQGTLLALGDMPFIAPDTYRRVQQALLEHPLVLPCFGEQRGHPVGFSHAFFEELMQLRGDQGAQALVRKAQSTAYRLPVDDPGILRDIDTQAALSALSDDTWA